MFTTQQLNALTDFGVDCHAADDYLSLARRANEAVARLVPCDVPGISFQPQAWLSSGYFEGPDRAGVERVARDASALRDADPAYTARLRLLRDEAIEPADFVPPHQFVHTPLYQLTWQPRRIRRQLRLFNVGSLSLTFTAERVSDQPFATAERHLLTAIARHTHAAVVDLARRGSGTLCIGAGTQVPLCTFDWLVCDADGRILRTTPASLRRLRECLGLGVDAPAPRCIPPDWIASLRRRAAGHPPQPVICYTARHQVQVYCAPIRATGGAEHSVGLLAKPVEVLPGAPRNIPGLTHRQAQILHWVREGKTNPEIGIILGISSLTVKKHLEHIYARLGVETRTAALRKLADL